ncbi:MAG: protein-export chaperone SecB [Clostridia bacterium]|nr:protein-export chaperone SecB [Clostridia bacterium]
MKEFELKTCKVESVEFINKLPSNVKIELSNKYSYNVGYSKLNTCSGEFKAEIFDKNSPERFRILVVMKGFFTISEGIAKEQLHIKTYDAIFPHVKAFVSTLTSNAGIPPIFIPYIDISNQSIYRVEMPGKIKRTEEEE